MGNEGYEIQCTHCNLYKKTYFTGVGMLMGPHNYINPPSIKPNNWNCISDETILKEIDDLMINKNAKLLVDEIGYDEEGEEETRLAYGYKLYYSPKLKREYCLFNFKLTYEEDNQTKIYEPAYKDNKGNLLQLMTGDDIYDFDYRCPICGKIIKSFYCSFICWD